MPTLEPRSPLPVSRAICRPVAVVLATALSAPLAWAEPGGSVAGTLNTINGTLNALIATVNQLVARVNQLTQGGGSTPSGPTVLFTAPLTTVTSPDAPARNQSTRCNLANVSGQPITVAMSLLARDGARMETRGPSSLVYSREHTVLVPPGGAVDIAYAGFNILVYCRFEVQGSAHQVRANLSMHDPAMGAQPVATSEAR